MQSVQWMIGYIEGRIDALKRAKETDRRNQPDKQDEIIEFYNGRMAELKALLDIIRIWQA